MNPNMLINPVVRWAVHPGHVGTIEQIDGMPPIPLPEEGAVLTVPFLVDPVSKQPVAIRVVQIQNRWDGQRHTLVVVVARHQPH